jgi:hypothetical protein
MRDELREWSDLALARLCASEPEVGAQYREYLDHYRAVAETLFARTGNEELARAGFLHGVPWAILDARLAGVTSPGVREVLRLYENFREFDVDSPLLSRELKASRLPGDHFSHAGILLVIEQLHHLDPAGDVSAWSRTFHVDTRNDLAHLPSAPSFPHGLGPGESERGFPFVRNVVAPIAQSLGMWHERNVLENAALLYADRETFASTLNFASRASSTRGACARYVAAVRDVLEPMGATAVRWEWRHIAKVADRRAARGSRGAHSRDDVLLECGFVTAVCRDKTRCYEALGRLQCAFGYTAEGVSEVVRHGVAGYDAIHVNLQVPLPSQNGERMHMVHAKLIPSDAAGRRFAAWERRELPAPGERAAAAEGPPIAVFTPDGRRIELRPGSTVLNFAYKLHDELVVRLRGAQVNQERVDVLHPLRNGDVVWLETAATPRALPADWEAHVPPATRKRIRKAYRYHYLPALRSAGLRWVQAVLRERGLAEEMAEAELERRIAGCVQSLQSLPGHAQARVPGWWLEQIGIMEAMLCGEQVASRLVLGEAHREQLVEALAQLPAPRGRGERRQQAQSRFLVIASRDRPGLVADVARMIADHRLSMTEMVAMRLDDRRGLVRVHLPGVHPDGLSRLIDALRGVSGVMDVQAPGQRPTAEEARYLPPRPEGAFSRPSQPSPYATGGEVRAVFNFYGREPELADLHRYFDEAVSGRRGSSAFVCGPKKLGKTSLVLAFLRELGAGKRGACLTLHLEAVAGEPFSGYARRLASELFRTAKEEWRKQMRTFPEPDLDKISLAQLVLQLKQRIRVPIVLAVDEAVALCASSQAAGETDELLRFNGRMAAERGVLVVWVGPTAALRVLEQPLLEMLRDAHRLRVPPLDRTAVEALLRAEKLRSKYTIHLDREVVETIYRTVSGNPYWASAIADAVWRSPARGGSDLVVFDPAEVRRAIEQTQQSDDFFADRYDVWTADENAVARVVLVALARASRGPRGKERGMKLAQITDIVRRAGLDPVGMERRLELLVDTGSIVQDFDRGVSTWRISAPLFAQHVLSKLGGAFTDTMETA